MADRTRFHYWTEQEQSLNLGSEIIMDRLRVHPDILKKLKAGKLTNLEDLVVRSPVELHLLANLSLSQAEEIQQQAATLLYPLSPSTADAMLATQPEKLPTGCESIDTILHGGLLCQGITELTGESACGKTQICMQLALTSQLVRRKDNFCNCLYICTEDAFPSQRLVQMERFSKFKHSEAAGKHRFTDNVFIEHLTDKEQLMLTLEHRVPRLLARGQTNLLIIDSLTAVFRGQEGGDQNMVNRSKDISAICLQLHKLSSRYNICVLCVNQVTANMNSFSSEKSIPALGLTWANLVTTRLQVKRSSTESPYRTLNIKFAPHLPNDICQYIITPDGVVSADG